MRVICQLARTAGAATAIVIACGPPLLAGCATTLDPAEDIDQAASVVTARSRSETGWTSPWSEPARQWDGRSPLRSDTAVRVALQNNRAIRRQVETIAASRADLAQAHLLPNPIVNVAVGFPTDGMGGEPLAAAVIQQLAWIWKRPAAIDAAQADLEQQVLAVSDAALALVADVRSTHATVAFAERTVALQQENVDLLERSVDLLRERQAVGEASRLEVNRVELDLREAEIRLTDGRTGLGQARRRMLELLGRADAPAEWQTDGGVPAPLETIAALDEDGVMRLAERQRLDVAAAHAVVDARTDRVTLQEHGRIPDIAAGAGYRQNFSSRPGVFPAAEVTPKLFDDNSARIARAESELRQAEIDADRVRQAAITEARLAWVALLGQQDVVRSYQDQILALAEANLGLAREAFEAGETDLTVLLETQRKRNDAGIELAERELAAARLLIELERAAGGSLAIESPVDEVLTAKVTGGGTTGLPSEAKP